MTTVDRLVWLLLLSFQSLFSSVIGCDTQDYNDGWKALQAFEEGRMTYASNETSNKCFSQRRVSLNESTKTAVYSVSYRGWKDSMIQNDTMHETIGSCPEFIDMYYESDPKMMYQLKIVFSDYKACLITNDGYSTKNTTECRMHVATDATTMDMDMCLKNFDKFCGSTKYETYDADMCSSKPSISPPLLGGSSLVLSMMLSSLFLFRSNTC